MTSLKKNKISFKQGALLRKDSRPTIPRFFEGPEKLLEIVFKADIPSSSSHDITQGLRIVPRTVWEEMLKLVGCEVLSGIHNEFVDAYMLSESSLFVFQRKILLKTCGSTTLLHAVPRIIEIAQKYCGFHDCENLFYSRKNFQKPHKQNYPHSSFSDEATVLDKYFQGFAYTLGRLNGEGDHWNLYLQESPSVEGAFPDHTLEILMHDLDPDATKQFFRDEHFVGSRHCSKAAGIMDLIPGATVDDLVFDPCGYSANGILGESYFTIHVTPQSECSYASFETNIVLESYTELVNKVLQIFRPGRFTLTYFTNEVEMNSCGQLAVLPAETDDFIAFRRRNKILYEFDTYQLYYAFFVKMPS